MKILQTSDWHLDWVTHGIRRFDEIRAAAKETVRAAIDARVDLYAFTGDLCDPDSGSIVFECIEVAVSAAMTLAHAGIPSVWLRGNHDVIEDGRDRSTLAPLCGLHEFVSVFETGGVMSRRSTVKEDYDIIALPYPSVTKPYSFDGVFEYFGHSRPSRNVIAISHLTVPDVQPGEEVGEMARGRDVLHPTQRIVELIRNNNCAGVMLQGHYHRQQSLNYDGIYMHIPGSLARLTFGEEWHTPGYMLIEVGR